MGPLVWTPKVSADIGKPMRVNKGVPRIKDRSNLIFGGADSDKNNKQKGDARIKGKPVNIQWFKHLA